MAAPRPNEHLAVLLPRSLWKRDSLAATCDTFTCLVIFSSLGFDRRHHCRKCGGVFCAKCTSRTTPLLDTTNLPFIHLPRNTSVYDYVPQAQVVDERVCDECWDQLYGIRGSSVPNSPLLTVNTVALPTSSSRASIKSNSSGDSSPASSTSPRTPPDLGSPLLLTASLSSISARDRTSSTPSIGKRNTVSSRASNPDLRKRATLAASAANQSRHPNRLSTPTSPVQESTLLPKGELSSYPLCRSSSLCKASGGGRWEPAQRRDREEERVLIVGGSHEEALLLLSPLSTSPSSSIFSLDSSPYDTSKSKAKSKRRQESSTLGIGKPLWEVEWEQRVSRERRRRENPVVRDGPNGEFCYRVYRGHRFDDESSEYDDWEEDMNSSTDSTGHHDRPYSSTTSTLGRSYSLSTF